MASQASCRGSQSDVLLVDTLGELLAFYAAGDVAFVGGSLVPVGGHNLLEPAALGKPTLTGPHSFNSPEAARLLEEAHALLRVTRCHRLPTPSTSCLLIRWPRRAQGQRAAAAVVANQGAAARALADDRAASCCRRRLPGGRRAASPPGSQWFPPAALRWSASD